MRKQTQSELDRVTANNLKYKQHNIVGDDTRSQLDDALAKIDELKICVAYEYNGEKIDCAYPGIDLAKVTPVYKTLTPFKDDFSEEKVSNELKDYIDLIEKFCEINVGILAYGPERSQIKFLKDYF